MNLRPALIVSAIVIVAQLVVAIVGLALVEPGIEVPVHWSVAGEPDGYASPVLAFLVVVSGLGAGFPMNVVIGIGVGVGVMFVVLGNVMTTIRSNFMFGVRTPWTLTSELSWKRTHRVVGSLFVAAGVMTVMVSLIAPAALVWFILGSTVLILVVSFVYSYIVWRDDPDKRDRGATEA